jgi:hypothetical protein
VGSLVPVRALISGALSISASMTHACALVAAGADCWGYDDYGQLGQGHHVKLSNPAPVRFDLPPQTPQPVRSRPRRPKPSKPR